ncbi:uncharacterized [Tachysurus ichikawai]
MGKKQSGMFTDPLRLSVKTLALSLGAEQEDLSGSGFHASSHSVINLGFAERPGFESFSTDLSSSTFKAS